jgi:hypothetical protein
MGRESLLPFLDKAPQPSESTLEDVCKKTKAWGNAHSIMISVVYQFDHPGRSKRKTATETQRKC